MPSFEDIRTQCLEQDVLWVDPDFSASPESIDPDYDDPEDWLWKRPKDICSDPQLFISGASRFDLAQGELGDCWFVAAAAVLATKRDLIARVVPDDQGFDDNYAGVFHFNLWRFGEWVEVVVDDQLPVNVDGELKFCHNRAEPDEFWGALLEKAYAKVNGCYRAIYKGFSRDALVDFTGGLSEYFNLKKEDSLPADFYDIVRKSYNLGSLLGAGIRSDVGETEEIRMYNGLYKGHCYSVTGFVEARVQGWNVKLIRLRNPWGRNEWNGPWSDGSDEWNIVPEDERKRLGLVFQDDGEFWMSWDDFRHNFTVFDIVHLGPEVFARLGFPEEFIQWHEAVHHGEWIKGVNAGGGGLISGDRDLYFTNPRYFLTLEVPDEDDVSNECTCIISIMLKDFRKRKVVRKQRSVFMGFDILQVKADPSAINSDNLLELSKLKKQFSTKTPMREATCRLALDPGTYCIIPCTLKPNQEAAFVLRIFTYSRAKFEAPQVATGPVQNRQEPVRPIGNVTSELFWQYAGEDHVVDARDLRDLLNELSRKELGETTAFSIEACRTMVSMLDNDRSGTLDFEEMSQLWDEILLWRKVFTKYDRDKSGCIDTNELRAMFAELGFQLSFETITTLAIRYGGKDRTIFFEDFVICIARTYSMYAVFNHYKTEGQTTAKLGLEEWMKATLYF